VALNVPLPKLVKVTVPVGVLGVTRSMSVTVAVQVVDSPGAITDGVQLTLVAVRRLPVITVALVFAETATTWTGRGASAWVVAG